MIVIHGNLCICIKYQPSYGDNGNISSYHSAYLECLAHYSELSWAHFHLDTSMAFDHYSPVNEAQNKGQSQNKLQQKLFLLQTFYEFVLSTCQRSRKV